MASIKSCCKASQHLARPDEVDNWVYPPLYAKLLDTLFSDQSGKISDTNVTMLVKDIWEDNSRETWYGELQSLYELLLKKWAGWEPADGPPDAELLLDARLDAVKLLGWLENDVKAFTASTSL